MDVVKPPLVWVGGSCYRKNPSANAASEPAESYQGYVADKDSAAPYSGGALEEPCNDEEDDSDVQVTNSGYQLSLDVPAAFFKFIIGKKGEAKRKIEVETRCQIQIPRTGMEGPIVVLGADKQGIRSARGRIDLIMESARRRLPITHFASLCVASTGIQQKFDTFKSDVLERFGDRRGIEASIFQDPSRLHITLSVLTLMSKNEVSKAANIFRHSIAELIPSVLNGQPLTARIRGLQSMNDDPSAVDVLYAQVLPSSPASTGMLQTLADLVVDRLVAAGQARKELDHVKLHVTLMNTSFREEAASDAATAPAAALRGQKPPPQRQAWNRRESFDATEILKEYCNYDFGEITFDHIHLSIRGTTSVSGYYESAAVVDLPK